MSETLKAVGHEVRNERGETVAECSSDARAIQFAAAPDLLAALEAIEARISGTWDNPSLVAFGPLSPDTEADCLTIARAAIAKAEGGASNG